MRKHESQSSLKLSACPKAYWDKYIGKNRAWNQAGSYALAGSAVHSEIEKALGAYGLTGEIDINADELATAMIRLGVDTEIIADMAAPVARGAKKLLPDTFRPSDIIEVEKTLKTDEMGIMAIIDAMMIEEDSVIIVDHKTQRHVPTEDELGVDLQTFTNACVVFETMPNIGYVNMIYHYYRWGARRVVSISRPDYEASIRPVLSALVQHARDIQSLSSAPEARPYSGCQYCPLLDDCWRGKRATDQRTTEELSVVAHVASEAANKARAEIRKRIDYLPPAKIGDVWAMKESISYSVPDMMEYIQLAIESGQPELYLSASKKNCEEALKSDALAPLIKGRISATLTLEKGNIMALIEPEQTEQAPAEEPEKPAKKPRKKAETEPEPAPAKEPQALPEPTCGYCSAVCICDKPIDWAGRQKAMAMRGHPSVSVFNRWLDGLGIDLKTATNGQIFELAKGK